MTGPREAVTGIGGVFIDADDPAALAAWYERHLGLRIETYGTTRVHVFAWRRDALPDQRLTTTWAIFKSDQPLPERRTARVNYHVDDLDRLDAQA